jgi:hypothetical protein
MMTPTARSLKKLRDEGWSVCVVEKWIPQMRRRVDAFRFGDLLACKVGSSGAMLVQTTSGTNASARIKKIRTIAEAGIWLAAGNAIQVHGWSKCGPRGKRKTWQCRTFVVTKENLIC